MTVYQLAHKTPEMVGSEKLVCTGSSPSLTFDDLVPMTGSVSHSPGT